jgi:hypothetical protein
VIACNSPITVLPNVQTISQPENDVYVLVYSVATVPAIFVSLLYIIIKERWRDFYKKVLPSPPKLY